jgi:hypothetical protein
MKLLIPCVLSDSNKLSVFYEFPDLKRWIITLILRSPHHITREEGARGLIALISQITKLYVSPKCVFHNMRTQDNKLKWSVLHCYSFECELTFFLCNIGNS